ncbi:MAG TPA: 30S ribosomal protein S9 [Candidatus Moranbacteria bacterium]|nr:30S ribosomal protein S9 [Candidatus Moranbacteria bacterium]
MVTKKIAKKEEKIVKEEKAVLKGEYFYAVGRRKTAIARVKIFSEKGAQNTFSINGKKLEEYFPVSRWADLVKAPLALAGEGVKFNVEANVYGGGVSAQADAVKLGIARALVVFNKELKKSLKGQKYLTRDPREVERKKFGLKKARRAPQWAKR